MRPDVFFISSFHKAQCTKNCKSLTARCEKSLSHGTFHLMHLNVPRDMKLTRGIKNVILKAGKAS